jgi:hypothetical protein
VTAPLATSTRAAVPAVLLAALLGAISSAQAQETALEALRRLPPERAAAVARIVGNEGKPQPARWHFLVSAPSEPRGFLEFVVSGGEIVASRNLSQFAESIAPGDVLGKESLQIDSGRAAAIAQDYAFANNAVITRIDYRLMKEGAEATPIWLLSCFGDDGKPVGTVTLTASKGTVVAHEGFAAPPAPAAVARATATPAPFDTFAETAVVTPTPTPTPAKTTARRASSDDDEEEHSGPSKAFRKVGGKLQKFFTGRDSISR